jgi:hypothetical protein
MSKSKVMTMTELKEKTSDIILTNDEYEAIIERINLLNNELVQSSELNDRNEIKEIYYKKEIDDLVSRCKEYKNKIKSKEDLDLANEEIMKSMAKNKQKALEKLSLRSNNKYTKKTKEQLEEEILNEITNFRNSYKDEI